jgi:hypothetical protein
MQMVRRTRSEDSSICYGPLRAPVLALLVAVFGLAVLTLLLVAGRRHRR